MKRNAKPKKTGRPSVYTEKLGTRICTLIAEGLTLRQVEREKGIPPRKTFLSWVLSNDEKYKDFRNQYELAMTIKWLSHADEILDIADDAENDWMTREGKTVLDVEHVQRSRLRIDARKWIASKELPKKFGDKIEEKTDATKQALPITEYEATPKLEKPLVKNEQ